DPGGRVEQHDVAHRALPTVERVPQNAGVVLRGAAEQIRQIRQRDAEVAGIEVVLVDVAAGDLPDAAVPRGGELVEAVVAAEHQRGGAASTEDARDEGHAVESRD